MPRQASTWLVLLLVACGTDPFSFSQALMVTAEQAGSSRGKVDSPLEVALRVDDGAPPFIWTRSGGVPGMFLDDMATEIARYTGVPAQAGTFFMVVQVTDANDAVGMVSLSFDIAPHAPAPRFRNEALPAALADTYYRAPIEVAGGEPPLAWTVRDLPEGLGFEESEAVVLGRVRDPGTYAIFVRVEDAERRSAEAMLSLQVVLELKIQTSTLAPAIAGSPYRAALAATGGLPPHDWQLDSGSLPSGLSLLGESIEGTPVETGSFYFVVHVSDASAQDSFRGLTLVVGE